ncbi:DUF4432 family protein [Paenibacillus sp. strain BS8-2]
MRLFGKQWTRRELEMHVGRLEQIGGIQRFDGAEGTEKGMGFIRVRTGAGLSYTVTPDKGLDFSLAEYGGTPISWQAQGGDVHPQYYDSEGAGWLTTASGGLMMTCGFMNVGSPSVYEGQRYGMHGRAHHLPARHVCAEGHWMDDEYEMVIKGQVEETSLFGGQLRLSREIRSRLGENRILVNDVVQNIGFESVPHMLLYHFNFGYPFLSPDTTISFPPGVVSPREEGTPLEGYDSWQAPESGYAERVYYHELKLSKRHKVELHQPYFPQAGGRHIPLTATLSWSGDSLPRLIQWKLAGAGTYVLGIEPSNCGVEGVSVEADRNTLVKLVPGQKIHYSWELNFD